MVELTAATSPPMPAPVAARACSDDLGENRDGSLFRRVGADIEPHGPGDALELLLGHARCPQPLAALLLCAA